MSLCGKRSLICYGPRTVSDQFWSSAALGTLKLQFKYNVQTTLPNIAPKVGAGKPAWIAFPIVDIDVRQDVILKLCTRFSDANSPVSADTGHVTMPVRKQPVAKIAEDV